MTFQLTPRQGEALRIIGGTAKHALLEGGSRSGKTFLGLRVVALRAMAAAKSRHAVLRLRFNHVKASVVLDTWPKMLQLCFPDVPWRLDRSDWFAEAPNGSQVWFGGLDDKERTEKILGQEYATIYHNEVSQIPWPSVLIARTRLAQRCMVEATGQELRLKALYDCNPPSQAHWAYKLFHRKIDPETGRPLPDPENYVATRINPRDNLANLPADYIRELEAMPARMRLRFLDGEYASATDGALWTVEMIDQFRNPSAIKVPDMVRVVVAVDPSGSGDTENAHNDAIGIMVCGLGTDGLAYVLEDCTVKAGPKTWGQVAMSAFDRHRADMLVAEANFGGEMVRFVIRAARQNAPVKLVQASRGKVVRAEPIASLTEQGKVRFAGVFPELEEELCAFTTAGYIGGASPNRADAFVWAMTELFPGIVKAPREEKTTRDEEYAGDSWMAA